MPSNSLMKWQTARMPNMQEFDLQCAASLVLVPTNTRLVEENLRGYIVLLSAHFQGFCRDLYAESAQAVVSKVRPSLQLLFQAQFTEHRALDHGNPNLHNLRRDFERFGFKLHLASADAANPARLQSLAELNEWRNIAAHHGIVPTRGLPTIHEVRNWRSACDGLAVSLDGIMYNELRRVLKRKPWLP